LPIIHWTAKLTIPPESDGILVPKAFKVGVLSEGTYKDFGYQIMLLRLLNGVISTFSGVRPSDFIYPDLDYLSGMSEHFLGVMAWNAEDCSENLGDRFMPLVFSNCVRDLDEIKLLANPSYVISHDGNKYAYIVTTSNYFDNEEYQRQLTMFNQRGTLRPPLGFPLANIEKFEDFSHPNWAGVFAYPNKKLRQRAEKSGEYVLIKRDTHKIYSWPAVQADPMLRLDLDMEDEWMWQEACPSPLPDITLCWSPALKYPWLRTTKTDEWIPALVLAEGIE
jgi:hypothetical protein